MTIAPPTQSTNRQRVGVSKRIPRPGGKLSQRAARLNPALAFNEDVADVGVRLRVVSVLGAFGCGHRKPPDELPIDD